MWRKTGEGLGLFGALTALAFLLVSGALVGLFILFILPSERPALRILITLTLVMGAAAFLLLFFQFAYHLITRSSARLDTQERVRLEAWLDYAHGEGPRPRLDALSASVLGRLRETTVGSYSDKFAQLYVENGFLERDIKSLRSRRQEQNSAAIARLGQVRSAAAIPTLQEFIAKRPDRPAAEAFRVLARCLDTEEVTPKMARREFERACESRPFTQGEIESALVLTGRHSGPLVRHLLHINFAPVAALTVMGHKYLMELVTLLPRYLTSEDAEVRAAALRAVASLELAPDGSEGAILNGLKANQSFVRAQAAKALVALPLERAEAPLLEALGDRNWWVRRNAAATLAGFGPAGRSLLARAALSHTDLFAREAARRAVR